MTRLEKIGIIFMIMAASFGPIGALKTGLGVMIVFYIGAAFLMFGGKEEK